MSSKRRYLLGGSQGDVTDRDLSARQTLPWASGNSPPHCRLQLSSWHRRQGPAAPSSLRRNLLPPHSPRGPSHSHRCTRLPPSTPLHTPGAAPARPPGAGSPPRQSQPSGLVHPIASMYLLRFPCWDKSRGQKHSCGGKNSHADWGQVPTTLRPCWGLQPSGTVLPGGSRSVYVINTVSGKGN